MFFLALVFNLLSSYFIASLGGHFLIMFVAFFALIILNIEILSLFSAISDVNLFIFSITLFLNVSHNSIGKLPDIYRDNKNNFKPEIKTLIFVTKSQKTFRNS